jgi:pyrimidine operon attenuation protein/uracil phosphoribosyltransferase
MSNNRKIILNEHQLGLTINRLSFEIIENHILNIENSVLIGMQPRGVCLAQKIHHILEVQIHKTIKFGCLDTTFFRDDFRRRKDILIPNKTNIDFSLLKSSLKNVVSKHPNLIVL